jgi:hypothetical protein
MVVINSIHSHHLLSLIQHVSLYTASRYFDKFKRTMSNLFCSFFESDRITDPHHASDPVSRSWDVAMVALYVTQVSQKLFDADH